MVYKDGPLKSKKPGFDFGSGLPRRKDSTGFGSPQDTPSPNPDSSKNVARESSDSPCSSSSEKNKTTFAPERVLSMKKSAEIAAMFTDMKLNPEPNFILTGGSDIEDVAGQQHNQDSTSIDFETSLGYLP